MPADLATTSAASGDPAAGPAPRSSVLPPSDEFSGRHAVVTGAAGGIGRAIACALLARGATVHGFDRDAAAQHSLTAQFEHADRYLAHVVDLTDRRACDRAVAQTCTLMAGRCDILVNNAAVSRLTRFANSDDELLDRLLATNFTAAFRVTRALLPALRAGGRGCVVNVASELALVGQVGYSAYSATKGAMLAWSRALAVELASEGIRVNTVCPGPIDTALLQREFDALADPAGARAEELASVPLGRLGAPPEVAAVVAFLASDAAAFVTGATWCVDGGKTAQ